MKLEIGQKWISESNSYEDFEIYDGIVDTCDDSFEDESIPFNEQPESVKIYFWRRINDDAFEKFIVSKKGVNYESTYPYAWSGETKKKSIVNKIKKNNMKLIEQSEETEG